MAKNKGGSYTPPTRAEIEAMRAEKMQLVPNGEAGRRERKLLEHYSAAQADLQWIVDNNAWHELGFDTFTGWYAARVRPAVAAAGLRPTQEFALYVLENVQSDEAKLPKQQRLLQRELAELVGVSASTLRRLVQDPSQTSNGAGVDLDESGPDRAAHTSAAGPAANTEGDSPVLGEPVGVDEQASTGTQSPPAADASTTLPHAGVPAVGDQIEERDEEEAAEASADLPAAATMSLPDGDGNPMPEQSQQPGQDSPTGLEAAQPRDDRSETIHHAPAGVSGVGEAPEEPRPSVEPVELEDGDGPPASSSSSDPDVAGNPAERLLFAVAGLVHYLDQVDVDAVGPLLLGPDVEQLFDHAEEITAHITRIGKARFAEMLTP